MWFGKMLLGWKAILLPASIMIIAGCANRDTEIARDRRSMDFERPQALGFFNSEANALFTDTRGFKARVNIEPVASASKSENTHLAGDLWGRDGKLLFIPEPTSRTHKFAGAAGTTFTWDNKTGEGYAVNELLEGIAPLPHYSGTNAAPEKYSEALGVENVAGEACQKTRITSVLAGRTNSVTAWRAPSLNGFPVQIQIGGDLNASVVRLTKVRFEDPPAEVFVRPDGLTPYASVDAMLYELARRESESRGIHGLSPDYPAGIPRYR
jgi:hypothetical protein